MQIFRGSVLLSCSAPQPPLQPRTQALHNFGTSMGRVRALSPGTEQLSAWHRSCLHPFGALAGDFPAELGTATSEGAHQPALRTTQGFLLARAQYFILMTLAFLIF